jgi:hypothetical protein
MTVTAAAAAMALAVETVAAGENVRVRAPRMDPRVAPK